MSTNFMVGGVRYSQKQIAMLCALVKGPTPMAGTTGYDRNTLAKLCDIGLIELDDAKATINSAGRKVVIEMSERVNGGAPPADKIVVSSKASKHARSVKRTRAPKDSPPPTGVVDFAALRAQIVAHYEADLAACDRMIEVAAKVGR